MARTDRLMCLMDALRRLPAPVTAARLAEQTGVSPRQMYRDIATLRAGGALIDGAAGVGYSLTEDPALPPQSFSRIEIEALMLAQSALEHLGDDTMIAACRNAMARIVATLPDSQARAAMHTVLHSWRVPDSRPAVTVDMNLLRTACWEEFSVSITYRDLNERLSQREIWPLALSYGERSLTLLAKCQLRADFRLFHVSRIERLDRVGNSFRPHRTALLREYVAGWRPLTPPPTPAP